MATYVDIGFTAFYNNSATGTISWSSVGAAISDNSDYAKVSSVTYSLRSHYIVGKQLSTALSTNCEILGLELIYQGFRVDSSPSLVADLRENSILLIQNNSFVGTDQAATAVTLTTSESTYTKGNSTYLGGVAWNASHLNSTGYGWAMSYRNHGFYGGHVYVDYMKTRVYYKVGADISQGIKLGDSVSRVASYHRSYPEALKLSDMVYAKLISVRNMSGGLKLNAVVAAKQVYGRNLSEGIKLGDSVGVKVTFNRGLSQPMKLNAVASVYKLIPNSFLTQYQPKWLVDVGDGKFSHTDIYVDT